MFLSPAGCKKSQNLAPLTFKAKYFGDSSSPRGLPNVWVCFSPIFMPLVSAPPTDSPVSPFSSYPYVYPSYPLSCGLFSTSSCGVYSASQWIIYWVYLHSSEHYIVVSMGWDEPRISLLSHLCQKSLKKKMFINFYFKLEILSIFSFSRDIKKYTIKNIFKNFWIILYINFLPEKDFTL